MNDFPTKGVHLAYLRAKKEAVFKFYARKSLLGFTLYTKDDYECKQFHKNLNKVLTKFARKEIKRLIVQAPPRVGKSEGASRRLPAFIYGLNPDAQIIAASYSSSLAVAMNRDVQKIIDSDKYYALFPDTRLYSGTNTRGEQVAKEWQRNNQGFEIIGRRGKYKCAGVGGGITGIGGDYLICDDLYKDWQQASSKTYRDQVYDWFNSTLYTRLEKDGCILLTMTRWHGEDLIGRLLSEAKNDPSKDQWTVVDFPMIQDKEPTEFDTRSMGEPLWPEKYSIEKCAATKATVGSKIWSSLYQQKPTNLEGSIIKREWIRFYKEAPKHFEDTTQGWDFAVKNTSTSDYCAGQVWGRDKNKYYLLDSIRTRADFPRQIQLVIEFSKKWPNVLSKVVEDKANGTAVMDTLKNSIEGLIGYNPDKSKELRLQAVAPLFEAGNVYLPDPSIAPWVDEFIDELVSFPDSEHDDMVDSCSMSITKLRTNTSTLEALLNF